MEEKLLGKSWDDPYEQFFDKIGTSKAQMIINYDTPFYIIFPVIM